MLDSEKIAPGWRTDNNMIIKIDNSPDIDTDRDCNSEERHILQKLVGWKTMVDSVAQFRQKKESALSVGWNNSGPVRETPTLKLVTKQMEKEILLRLRNANAQ